MNHKLVISISVYARRTDNACVANSRTSVAEVQVSNRFLYIARSFELQKLRSKEIQAPRSSHRLLFPNHVKTLDAILRKSIRAELPLRKNFPPPRNNRVTPCELALRNQKSGSLSGRNGEDKRGREKNFRRVFTRR